MPYLLLLTILSHPLSIPPCREPLETHGATISHHYELNPNITVNRLPQSCTLPSLPKTNILSRIQTSSPPPINESVTKDCPSHYPSSPFLIPPCQIVQSVMSQDCKLSSAMKVSVSSETSTATATLLRSKKKTFRPDTRGDSCKTKTTGVLLPSQ